MRGLLGTARTVVLTLDGDHALVEGRRRRRRVREPYTVEHARDTGLLLRQVLETSSLLRPGGRCDLRLVWDPARLLLRMSHTGAVDLGGLDPDCIAVRVVLDDPSGRALDVAVPRRDVEDIVAALDGARLEGRARLDIGVLVRTRRIVSAIAADVEGRCGMVVDVTSSAVSVLRLRGSTVVDVRCATRSRLRDQIASMVTALATTSPTGVGGWCEAEDASARRPWFWIDAPDEDVAIVRRACQRLLPAATSADLAIARCDPPPTAVGLRR